MQKREEITTLPGIMATIAAGFDLTTKNLWLLLLPILLDIFYWLGPRLTFGALIEQGLALLPEDPLLADLVTQMGDLTAYTNLFTNLSVPLIGVPAMLLGLSLQVTPIPTSAVAIESPLVWLGLFLLLSIIGMLLTAIYYTTIAAAIKSTDDAHEASSAISIGSWAQRIGRNWLRLLGLALVFLFTAFLILIPISIMGGLVSLVSPTLSVIVVIGSFVLIYWIILFLCLAPYGIVLNGRPVTKAIRESITIARTYPVPTMGIIVFTLLLNTILRSLLMLAENGTWFTAINIIIHSFVNTALVTALFIYYRDRYRSLYLHHPTTG